MNQLPGKDGGHVYVIEVAEGICKIGASNNPTLRIQTHSAALPVPFSKTFITARLLGYMRLESSVHAELRAKKIRNEVFAVPFGEAVSIVALLMHDFDPAPKPPAKTPADPAAVGRWADLLQSINRLGLALEAESLGFDEKTVDLVHSINPAAAAIALAAALSKEAPSAEIAYAFVVQEAWARHLAAFPMPIIPTTT